MKQILSCRFPDLVWAAALFILSIIIILNVDFIHQAFTELVMQIQHSVNNAGEYSTYLSRN